MYYHIVTSRVLNFCFIYGISWNIQFNSKNGMTLFDLRNKDYIEEI